MAVYMISLLALLQLHHYPPYPMSKVHWLGIERHPWYLFRCRLVHLIHHLARVSERVHEVHSQLRDGGMVVVSNLMNSLTAESIIQYFITRSDLVVGVL